VGRRAAGGRAGEAKTGDIIVAYSGRRGVAAWPDYYRASTLPHPASLRPLASPVPRTLLAALMWRRRENASPALAAGTAMRTQAQDVPVTLWFANLALYISLLLFLL